MYTDILNIGLGFIEGFGLIISPCILPILPLILSGSLTGSKQRPFGIVCGFVLFFAVFTFFSRALVHISGIDLNLIRYFSYLLLIIFGVVMLSTYFSEKFFAWTARLANVGKSLSTVNDVQGGFFSGIVFGGLVALIWTPCAGPILAAVIVQTVIQQTTLASFLVLLAFAIGAAVPMLVIALFGREVMMKFAFFKTHSQLLRKLLGAIVIASVVYMIYSEGAVQTYAATTTTKKSALTLQDEILNPYAAPEIAGITSWINSAPLTLSQLQGKVVLIDFWTYSCINCLRTLPYLKDWYQKYHDKGLVIIGVHAPEFDFEKNLENVKNAVKNGGILYPVALDNAFQTWRNFQNRYWPAHYLINQKGYVVYQHFGEGNYDITENNIRYLLNMTQPAAATAQKFEPVSGISPETYLGFARAENFASPQTVQQNQIAQYTYPAELPENAWALQGEWKILHERVVAAAAGSAIKFHFNARHVYIVMGSATGQPIQVNLRLNGEALISKKGKDVVNSRMVVAQHKLYEVIAMPSAESAILQIEAAAPGLEVYTFTFG